MTQTFQDIIAKALPILKVVGIVLAVYLGIVWLSLVVWTYQDIRSRSESLLVQLLSTLLVLLGFLPGYWIYLLLRPKEALAETYARSLEREYIMQDIEERPVCPTCQRGVEPDFLVCPYCHTPLKKKCTACTRLMDLTWQVCPYCGQ
jgi:RNA polymerase subunit RPABC4/transcription elongation factor Spt4